MKHEIIQDLLPLYIDNVCSEATRLEVEQHLKECDDCRTVYENMKKSLPAASGNLPKPREKVIYLKTRQHIANFLICCTLIAVFILIAFAAFNEVGEHGWPQGIFAMTIIIPATAVAISLLNFFFFRRYPSANLFCIVCAAITFLVCAAGDAFAFVYYSYPENWLEILPYCLLIAVFAATADFFASRIYCQFFKR